MTAIRNQIHIRWVLKRDMPSVLRIERLASDRPWMMDDFMRALRQRNCIGMVAEHGDRVVGYMIYELHPEHLQLVKLAVSPGLRRTGIGSQMARKLAAKLGGHRRAAVVLTVGEWNVTAQLFFRSQGYRAERVVGDGRDEIEFAYRVGGAR